MRISNRPVPLVAAGVLLLSLAVSVSLYLASGANRVQRTFFFPKVVRRVPSMQVRLAGEQRRLPVRRGLEQQVRLVVQEVLLGPADPQSLPLISHDTHLIGVVVADHNVYVNLGDAILSAKAALPPEIQISALAHNIYFNFPAVKRVYVMIDGQTPDFSQTTGDRNYDYSGGIERSHGLLQ